jgi:hypothetical protein
MLLADNFIFSQNSLQNYIDCKRRFYLKEIQQLLWPALESEPTRLQEERTALGAEFHLLCNQYFSGVPENAIRESINSPEILQWWNAFISLGLKPAPHLQPEKAITVPFMDFRLTVHYDLLKSNQDGHYFIYDWKTNLKQPQRAILGKRMQTIIYPLVLQMFCEINDSKNAQPENIEMVYWYPVYPDRPIEFRYDQETYLTQKSKLEGLISEILQNEKEDFTLTEKISHCMFCQYRSFCNRGEKAGEFTEETIDFAIDDALAE